MSSLENAFRVVDIGPNAENKEEVFAFSLLDFFFFWGGWGVGFHGSSDVC